MKILNEIVGIKNKKIYQDTEMFNFCLDSILLAKFYVPKKYEKNVCDFGTNNAIIPIIISERFSNDVKIFGIEIQEQAVQSAIENIEMNQLSKTITIINQDIKEYIKDKNNFFDVIYSNPPYFKINEGSKLNKKSEHLIAARHEKFITLEEIIYSAKVGLKNGGKFLLVHLAERIDEIIFLLRKHNFTVKKIQFVHFKKNKKAERVLIEAVNDGNDGAEIIMPLIIHEDNGEYTLEAKQILGD
ncbi:tRNA1(Val) (adenine(37)-N6)-methyltransferase [Spiroplasma culicicola]|uniref:Methyltransferase n=1 Tax=Spiroplasma culicicola AES-1 TaxID=1276246 RepID=W6A5T6_9MOLU|nr:methyltransferase [Spiroplasma culicicola]AHI52352.1 methyltransferase [Spiroplasma culicicola AES-1]